MAGGKEEVSFTFRDFESINTNILFIEDMLSLN
jgi:hypothetical protein